MLDFDFEFQIKVLGLTEADMEALWKHFTCDISLEDLQSMQSFKNTEEMFKYLFVDDENKEEMIDTLLRMGKVSREDLEEGESVMEHMLGFQDHVFKLPSGRWIMFDDDLLRKDMLAQMD